MKFFLSIIFLFCYTTSYALGLVDDNDKKAVSVSLKTIIKNSRSAIKNCKDQTNQLNQISLKLQDTTLSNENKAELFYISAQLEESINSSENLKAYLKQSYDTLSFFNSIIGIYNFVSKCDSVDTLVNSKDKVKPIYQQSCKDLVLKYRTNLFAGGRYYMRKNKFEEAFNFFDVYIKSANSNLLDFSGAKKDTLLYKAYILSALSSYHSNQYQTFLESFDAVVPYVHSDSLKIALYEYKARSYQCLNDTVDFIKTLQFGVDRFPSHDYFFLNLLDEYNRSKRFDDGLSIIDKLTYIYGSKSKYLLPKSLMYLSKCDYINCINTCDSILSIEPDNVQALYNKAISYLNIAVQFSETACTDIKKAKCRKDRQTLLGYYRSAQYPMEKYRELCPEEKERWAQPLYRIYLNLNMGKEFSEIEKILNE